jgi:recombination protein RecT
MSALATREPSQSQLITLLSRPDIKDQMALALPKHVTAERLARLALTCVRKDQKLANCDRISFLSSLMQAAALGLEPGVNGACFLIPYGKECTFVPGWKGLVDLVNRTGRATVWTGAVFEGDDFDYALGDRPYVTHRPGDESDPARLTHVYAIGRVNGSEFPIVEVWSMKKIARHRDSINKQGQKHYSFRNPEMYARKVPLLQVIKYLPCSIEVAQAVELNEQAERGYRQDTPLAHLTSTAQDSPKLPESITVAAAPLSDQQLVTIRTAMDRRLNPVGVAAFTAQLGQTLEEVPADQFSAVMARLSSTEAVHRWNAGFHSETGDQLLDPAEIERIVASAVEPEQQPAANDAAPVRRRVGAA